MGCRLYHGLVIDHVAAVLLVGLVHSMGPSCLTLPTIGRLRVQDLISISMVLAGVDSPRAVGRLVVTTSGHASMVSIHCLALARCWHLVHAT